MPEGLVLTPGADVAGADGDPPGPRPPTSPGVGRVPPRRGCVGRVPGVADGVVAAGPRRLIPGNPLGGTVFDGGVRPGDEPLGAVGRGVVRPTPGPAPGALGTVRGAEYLGVEEGCRGVETLGAEGVRGIGCLGVEILGEEGALGAACPGAEKPGDEPDLPPGLGALKLPPKFPPPGPLAPKPPPLGPLEPPKLPPPPLPPPPPPRANAAIGAKVSVTASTAVIIKLDQIDGRLTCSNITTPLTWRVQSCRVVSE